MSLSREQVNVDDSYVASDRPSKQFLTLKQKRASKQLEMQASRQDTETRRTLDMLQQINRDASREKLTRGAPKDAKDEQKKSYQTNVLASQETEGGNGRAKRVAEIKVQDEDYQEEFEDLEWTT